jgi:hypothetical protein
MQPTEGDSIPFDQASDVDTSEKISISDNRPSTTSSNVSVKINISLGGLKSIAKKPQTELKHTKKQESTN